MRNPDARTRGIERRIASGDQDAWADLIRSKTRSGDSFDLATIPWDAIYEHPNTEDAIRSAWPRLTWHGFDLTSYFRQAERVIGDGHVPRFGPHVTGSFDTSKFRSLVPALAIWVYVGEHSWQIHGPSEWDQDALGVVGSDGDRTVPGFLLGWFPPATGHPHLPWGAQPVFAFVAIPEHPHRGNAVRITAVSNDIRFPTNWIHPDDPFAHTILMADPLIENLYRRFSGGEEFEPIWDGDS